PEPAREILDHGTPGQIVLGQHDSAGHGKMPVVERGVVSVEDLAVLAVGRSDATDCGNAESEHVALRARGVTLEVALEAALALRHGKLVRGLGKMIHADIYIPGAGQAANRQRQD